MLYARKSEHLQICLNERVRSATTTGLERYHLIHQALPEMALEEVSTATEFLGHPLNAPLLISSMTGGTALAQMVNQRLATAAQELGLAMGLGSQRTAIEEPALAQTFQVRHLAPDALLFANLGAVQLNYGYGPEECLRAVETLEADALVLHLNPLQEALQPEGDTNFAGLLEKIGQVCHALPVPVIVKEVGWGLSQAAAQALRQVGVAALDVAGAGGTSWSEVERHRSASPADAEIAAPFVDWGIPTAESLTQVRQVCPDTPLIASGGITNGVEVGVCLALGANLVGMAYPLLRPATESAQAVIEKLTIVLRQLRVAMFCSGAASIARLDRSRLMLRSE
ncbi:MAG: type 2 isopentenyl-diphosphate Delta-isomerase [Chloroflexi bacterium]|jgi:isopentenyl-diphosphate delta-isomerase|nr:type 2 isopentenyl-diphosphate Delta-isomerase [Chloroflexota bacterium]